MVDLDANGRAARLRAGRRPLVAATACAVAAVMLPSLVPIAPLLVWNASASMPLGLYAVEPGRVAPRGAVVVARLPLAARKIAAQRGYLPSRVPAVKRIAAVEGDLVCARGVRLFVNGGIAALRRVADGAGRPLRSWNGCRRLAGEVLLLGEDPRSFDSRYFGPVPRGSLVGTARPLWAR